MIDLSLFRHFVPLGSLAPGDRRELANYAFVRTLLAGEEAFREGGLSQHALFLLSGALELSVQGQRVERVEGGSERARRAVCNGPVFPAGAHCLRDTQLLYIDRSHLDRVLTWSQSGTIEVRDINDDGNGDWMAAMLRSPVLQQVPPANIVRVISSVEQVEFAAGETIIRLGADGDFYYVIVRGECRVLRPVNAAGDLGEVDRIGCGRGFGEEALVSGLARNATVEAVTDCALVRLQGRDFMRFLREPLVQIATLADVEDGVLCVDVRLPEEYAGGHLPGAVNLPLRDLRGRCRELDSERPAIVYCDGGGRSASATFLLRERGFNVRWLQGGVPCARLSER